MSLTSVFQTARSGMSAATAMVDAVSHNIANSQTNGYKASRPVYATQGTSTRSGGDPLGIGMGVRVAGFVTDYSQGPLVASSVEADWGDGGWTDDGENWVGSGVVELSNTDVGESLVDLILSSEQFLANVSLTDTADIMLGELTHLGRRSD
jgi:flagellar hook protein FlgE